MKKTLILFTLIINTFVFAQITYVPDDNFEATLIYLGYDSGALDNYVPTANISSVTSLSISNKNISNLTGIEDFISLTNLLCWNNNLSQLDLSQNTALTGLKCNGNQLTSLDLSNNLLLTILKCYANNLTNLDVSLNTNLTFLRCEGNMLENLNVKNGNNVNFTNFNAINNLNLTCIEVDDATYSVANWTNIDSTSTFVNNQAECNALSLSENSLNPIFSIYPNPIKNVFKIHTNLGIEKVRIYNCLGKQVKAYNSQDSYDISNLSKGLYFIVIKSENRIDSKKLIVL